MRIKFDFLEFAIHQYLDKDDENEYYITVLQDMILIPDIDFSTLVINHFTCNFDLS